MSAGEDIRRLLRDGPVRPRWIHRHLFWYSKVTLWNNLMQLRKMNLIERTKTKPYFYQLPKTTQEKQNV